MTLPKCLFPCITPASRYGALCFCTFHARRTTAEQRRLLVAAREKWAAATEAPQREVRWQALLALVMTARAQITEQIKSDAARSRAANGRRAQHLAKQYARDS